MLAIRTIIFSGIFTTFVYSPLIVIKEFKLSFILLDIWKFKKRFSSKFETANLNFFASSGIKIR